MEESFTTLNDQWNDYTVITNSGAQEKLDIAKVKTIFSQGWEKACQLAEYDLTEEQKQLFLQTVLKSTFNEIKTKDILRLFVLTAVSVLERDPFYGHLAATYLRIFLYQEYFQRDLWEKREFTPTLEEQFISTITEGVKREIFSPHFMEFDLPFLAQHLSLKYDNELKYMGLQVLYDRYLLKSADRQIIEVPQTFWLRVAMGLAIKENSPHKEQYALEFYHTMASLSYIPSTPTLFHSGLKNPQLSSCYLSTIEDDLSHIFKVLGDNAQLAKWSGGIGNDWSNIRGTGSLITKTNVLSQGVIPFLKIANDITVAINRSGKRRGAACAYLEFWHWDIEDFMDLRRNTGDERRRTHDMQTAVWIPDLFMLRLKENQTWSLFSPDEVPDLHHIYGKEFEQRYLFYEEQGEKGALRLFRRVSAQQLWRRLLMRIFETGHPWICFKDPSNIRSPQDHIGVVHNSNLCTEITLNTSKEETAVCNLGSINLAKHLRKEGNDWVIDKQKIKKTVTTAMRMLDNVIDINFYPTSEAKHSNLKHRPIGLGTMGWQDLYFKLRLPYDSPQATELTDELMEYISYHALNKSAQLAQERGIYPSFLGSKWSKGILPVDTLDLLAEQRNRLVDCSRKSRLDWDSLRQTIKKGMRNSNVLAIAPTATIANIAGCYPSFEAIYSNVYTKSNMNGDFVVINESLVNDLKELNLWNRKMLDELKYYDGQLANIATIPEELKSLYRTVFENSPIRAVELTAVRGKWIDQSQSHNIFMRGSSGKLLESIYIRAWEVGLKTTYYLRTLAISQIEKSTLDAKEYAFTQKRD